MTKYRIKCVIEYASNKYYIQYKYLFFWHRYIFKTCRNFRPIMRNKWYYTSEDEARDDIEIIKSLYRGWYRGHYIFETFNGKFLTKYFTYKGQFYETEGICYRDFESLQELKNELDRVHYKPKVTYTDNIQILS